MFRGRVDSDAAKPQWAHLLIEVALRSAVARHLFADDAAQGLFPLLGLALDVLARRGVDQGLVDGLPPERSARRAK